MYNPLRVRLFHPRRMSLSTRRGRAFAAACTGAHSSSVHPPPSKSIRLKISLQCSQNLKMLVGKRVHPVSCRKRNTYRHSCTTLRGRCRSWATSSSVGPVSDWFKPLMVPILSCPVRRIYQIAMVQRGPHESDLQLVFELWMHFTLDKFAPKHKQTD